jgi:hypothetical protein
MIFAPSSENELKAAIQKLADASKKPIEQELKKQMRLFAVDLAANTNPAGAGDAAKAKGDENISKRIKSIYYDLGVGYEILEMHKEGYGAAFLSMVKKRKFSEAAGFLSKFSRKKFTIGRFDGGKLHRDQRFSRGRVKNRMIVLNFKAVEAYIKKVQRTVGFAKGGFAAAARQLGGPRGIPGFASRQKAPGTGAVTGAGNTLSVTMTNGVRHIRLALTAAGEAKAMDFRRRQIEKVLRDMTNRKPRVKSPALK